MNPVIPLHGQDYKRLYAKYARAGKNFIDEYFPASNESLWSETPLRFPVEWKRCKELSSRPHLFTPTNGSLQNDVIQGAVGNCWLVSALSVLRTHPKLLNKVIPYWWKQEWVHPNRNAAPQPLPVYDNEPDALGYYDVPERETHPGIFRFRFYRFGHWVEVVVDDYLPVYKQRRPPGSVGPIPPPQLVYAHSQNPNEFWCSLLEKAYAKLCGSYEALEAGSVSDALVDLTGTVPETIELRSEEFRRELHALDGEDATGSHRRALTEAEGDQVFFKRLKEARKRDALMSCSISLEEADGALEAGYDAAELDNGLIAGHSYGITDLRRIRPPWYRISRKDVLLIRLHNPWGQGEWNGAWSDGAPQWEAVPASKKRELGVRVANDGDFWMSFADWRRHFDTLILCRPIQTSRNPLLRALAWRRWHAAAFFAGWVQLQGTAGGCLNFPETFPLNHQYAFSLRKTTVCVISLMQRDSRRSRHLGVENLTIGYVILRVEENRYYKITDASYEVVGQVTYVNAREVSGRFRLSPGRYVCIPTTFNAGEEGDFFIRFFYSSKRSVKVTELIRDGPPNPWFWKVPSILSRQWRYYYDGYVRVSIVSADIWDPNLEDRIIGPWRPGREGSRSALSVHSARSGERLQRHISTVSSSGPSSREPTIEGFECYAIVIFTNLRNGRRGKEYQTRPEKNTLHPQFDQEFVHYVRRPRMTGVIVQLWERRRIFEDRLLGEIRFSLEKYTSPDRIGRTWEIQRDLTYIQLVPMSSMTPAAVSRERMPGSLAGPAASTTSFASRSQPPRASKSNFSPSPSNSRSRLYLPDDLEVRRQETRLPRSVAAKRGTAAQRREIALARKEMNRAKGGLKVPRKVDAGTGELIIRVAYLKGQMGDL